MKTICLHVFVIMLIEISVVYGIEEYEKFLQEFSKVIMKMNKKFERKLQNVSELISSLPSLKNENLRDILKDKWILQISNETSFCLLNFIRVFKLYLVKSIIDWYLYLTSSTKKSGKFILHNLAEYLQVQDINIFHVDFWPIPYIGLNEFTNAS